MSRPLHLLLLLACLAAAGAAAYQHGELVFADDNDTNDVEPRAKVGSLAAFPRWASASTPRSRPSTPRRHGLFEGSLRWGTPSTPRRPNTTSRRPNTTTRRPNTTTRRPTTTTRRPTTPSAKDQSITIGGLYPYDRQLVVKTVYKSASFLSVNTEFLNVSNLPASIHCIQIVDQQRNGENAVATVQSGGLGHNNVSIKFKSQRGGKINYVVIIWGQ